MKIRTRKRLLLIALVCAIVSLSVYFLSTQSEVSNDVASEQVTDTNNNEVDKDDGLLDTSTEAEVRGFYRSQERGGSEMFGGASFLCNQIVITDGADIFGAEYREMIEYGNTVNQFDDEGRLVLNLDFSEVDNQTQDRIMNTSEEDTTIVHLAKLPPGPGRGVDPCYSFVEIKSASLDN